MAAPYAIDAVARGHLAAAAAVPGAAAPHQPQGLSNGHRGRPCSPGSEQGGLFAATGKAERCYKAALVAAQTSGDFPAALTAAYRLGLLSLACATKLGAPDEGVGASPESSPGRERGTGGDDVQVEQRSGLLVDGEDGQARLGREEEDEEERTERALATSCRYLQAALNTGLLLLARAEEQGGDSTQAQGVLVRICKALGVVFVRLGQEEEAGKVGAIERGLAYEEGNGRGWGQDDVSLERERGEVGKGSGVVGAGQRRRVRRRKKPNRQETSDGGSSIGGPSQGYMTALGGAAEGSTAAVEEGGREEKEEDEDEEEEEEEVPHQQCGTCGKEVQGDGGGRMEGNGVWYCFGCIAEYEESVERGWVTDATQGCATCADCSVPVRMEEDGEWYCEACIEEYNEEGVGGGEEEEGGEAGEVGGVGGVGKDLVGAEGRRSEAVEKGGGCEETKGGGERPQGPGWEEEEEGGKGAHQAGANGVNSSRTDVQVRVSLRGVVRHLLAKDKAGAERSSGASRATGTSSGEVRVGLLLAAGGAAGGGTNLSLGDDKDAGVELSDVCGEFRTKMTPLEQLPRARERLFASRSSSSNSSSESRSPAGMELELPALQDGGELGTSGTTRGEGGGNSAVPGVRMSEGGGGESDARVVGWYCVMEGWGSNLPAQLIHRYRQLDLDEPAGGGGGGGGSGGGGGGSGAEDGSKENGPLLPSPRDLLLVLDGGGVGKGSEGIVLFDLRAKNRVVRHLLCN